MRGVQTQILTPPPLPLPPWEIQFVEVVRTTLGPNLAPKAPEFFFFGIWWGLKIYFTLCVYAQTAQIFVGNSNVHAKQGEHLHP